MTEVQSLALKMATFLGKDIVTTSLFQYNVVSTKINQNQLLTWFLKLVLPFTSCVN